MSARPHIIWIVTLASITALLLLACTPTQEAHIGDITVVPGVTVLVGQEATLSIDAQGANPAFAWSVSKGQLSEPAGNSIIYTAPLSPGVDTVSVAVTIGGVTTTKSITIQVVEPPSPTAPPTEPPTSTSTPNFTPTPETPTPPPPSIVDCRHPEFTAWVFPQLKDIAGQRAFYGPLATPDVFRCDGVGDRFRSSPYAVRIEYKASPGKFGWFGIGTLGGYGVPSNASQICLWAYAEQPVQVFRIKFKDTSNRERGVDVTVPETNEWVQICVDLKKISDLGVNLSRLDNINLGFEETNGSATVWVDDFELK